MPSLLQTFKDKYESLRGHVEVAASSDEAARIAWEICQQYAPQCVAIAELPADLRVPFQALCAENDVTFLEPPYAASSLPNALDEAQVGITAAEFAIAATGTLVEVAVDDATRLVSSLPKVHIGIVHEADFLPDLFDSAERLREIFARHDRNCVVSFISGPSRTGDIELRLTLGVHGPEHAYVIVLTGSEKPEQEDA